MFLQVKKSDSSKEDTNPSDLLSLDVSTKWRRKKNEEERKRGQRGWIKETGSVSTRRCREKCDEGSRVYENIDNYLFQVVHRLSGEIAVLETVIMYRSSDTIWLLHASAISRHHPRWLLHRKYNDTLKLVVGTLCLCLVFGLSINICHLWRWFDGGIHSLGNDFTEPAQSLWNHWNQSVFTKSRVCTGWGHLCAFHCTLYFVDWRAPSACRHSRVVQAGDCTARAPLPSSLSFATFLCVLSGGTNKRDSRGHIWNHATILLFLPSWAAHAGTIFSCYFTWCDQTQTFTLPQG